MVVGLPAVPALDPLWTLGCAARSAQRHRRGRRDRPDDRQHHRPGSSLRCRRKGGTQNQGLGRSKGGFTTKIHLRANGHGLPIAIDISPGQASDFTGAIPLMDADGPQAKVLIGDRGYDSNNIRQTLESRDIVPVIPTKKNRKVQIKIDDYIYALRNRIERCINKLKNSRRLATRYDKTATSYLAFVQIASIRLWTNEFVNRT